METRSLAGAEVPITGSDSVKWIEISVPSSFQFEDTEALPSSPSFAPPAEDAASCSIVGSPPTYCIWRIHKDKPRVLEIEELRASEEFPKTGLRIIFPDSLSPFALICKDESQYALGNPYLLYALTVSGVAYSIKLKSIHNYASGYTLSPYEVVEFNIQQLPNAGVITSVAAMSGCLVVGRDDGVVSCLHLGRLEPSDPGFMLDLRDDTGFGRLWGLMSRRSVGSVQGMVISDVHDMKLLFVLHHDGTLRIWDIVNGSRIFSQTLTVPSSREATFLKLYVGEAHHGTNYIPLGIFYRNSLEVCTEMITVYYLRFTQGDRNLFSLDTSVQNIPLEEGMLIDVKLTSDKIWILKEQGLLVESLISTNGKRGVAQCYALQEALVADQLFQNSQNSLDDFIWLAQTVFSSVKDEILPLVSSIFLRRILFPGVHHATVLRATLGDFAKHLSDSDYNSLSAEGLKKEILTLVEQEGLSGNPISILYFWRNFCTHYFNYWCKINAPFGFLVDSSTGAIILVRKSSTSLFRCLEDIERTYGSFNELADTLGAGIQLPDDVDQTILFDLLQSISNVSRQLGNAASAIYYESLLSAPSLSPEEVVPRLLKTLESGYSSSGEALQVSELGSDAFWEKKVTDHKNLRKFSVDIFLSLHALRNKTTSWGKVLDVMESFLKFLVPNNIKQKSDIQVHFNIDISVTVQAISQVAKVMFESTLDVLVLLNYLANISGQIHMSHEDVSRIKLELIPMIQEIIAEWHIIHFLATTPSEIPTNADFSSQLSSLQIDNNTGKRPWNEKLGKGDFTLACVFLPNIGRSSEDPSQLCASFPNPESIIRSMRDFTSWIVWGKTGKESHSFFSHSTELALILLRHGQYAAAEYLLTTVDAHLRKEKTSQSVQGEDGEWCKLLHLLGCCLLAQVQRGLVGKIGEKKINEAVRCLFRASSFDGAPEVLQSLANETGLPCPDLACSSSATIWKLQYYQWAMQIFEQYNLSSGACQFALAALEQVDEALGTKVDTLEAEIQSESAITIRGRLWANVFKFTLDLSCYYDAYCAIISNPDEESKYLCLRRFIIVLYERGALKVLCDGQLPFIGLADKIERELAWKAARSDISTKPNPFRLLYAFEMRRHNWRKAATYMYLYASQIRTEAANKDFHPRSMLLQERLNGLSAAINALHLVHSDCAWINPILDEQLFQKEHRPIKKARLTEHEQLTMGNDGQPQRSQSYIDVEKLENEIILTSAEYTLSMRNVKWTFSGNEKPSPDLVDLLIQVNIYDMAFTIILRFWKGSKLKSELERVFTLMALKFCPNSTGPPVAVNLPKSHGLLLTSSQDEVNLQGSFDASPPVHQSKVHSQWEMLESYLEKYKGFHPRLPVVVAETLLSNDSQIELPLWLVQMFKGNRRESIWGMSGDESNPASLFRLYVDYGRFAEATNLFLEYIELFASMRPSDIIHRKRPFAVWFPYSLVERLWCQLDELINRGYMVDQSKKLRHLLQVALSKHLHLLKVDSEDTMSTAT
ncbi:nuclear pore complex protein NUP160 [Impatiens glandulifera]|uniref:nuclear pore complex protein NUP160 n=1 Tax=Impatiens glandulifera TaxID=253017 RepID=UPI001FB15E9D|nr:nuclear pore complex protein NUP160 [Impatiens glandulifera]